MHQCDNVTRLFWIHHEEPIKNPQHNKTFEIFAPSQDNPEGAKPWHVALCLCVFVGDHGNPGISNPLYSKLGVIQLRQLCQTRAPKTETKASCD